MRLNRKIVFVSLLSSFLLYGCTSETSSTSGITSPTSESSTSGTSEELLELEIESLKFQASIGEEKPSDPNATGSGPWSTSLNLQHISAQGELISDTWLTDQAGVPNLLVDQEGKVSIYFQSWAQGNVIAVAKQDSSANDWSLFKVRVNGFDIAKGPNGVDPSAINLSDGGVRLYWMQSMMSNASEIFSAKSTKSASTGIIFEFETNSRVSPGKLIFDPTVAQIDDRFYLWADTAGGSVYAQSDDGLIFIEGNNPLESDELFPWSAYSDGNSSVLYVTSKKGSQKMIAIQGGEELSVQSFDGPTLPNTKLRDMSVAKLADGTWLIAYLKEM